MTNDEARRVLEGMNAKLSEDGIYLTFKEVRMDNGGMALGVASIGGYAVLGRHTYSADQLEAIAMWMRDPKGVTEGKNAL